MKALPLSEATPKRIYEHDCSYARDTLKRMSPLLVAQLGLQEHIDEAVDSGARLYHAAFRHTFEARYGMTPERYLDGDYELDIVELLLAERERLREAVRWLRDRFGDGGYKRRRQLADVNEELVRRGWGQLV